MATPSERSDLASAIESFLNDEVTAFEFDELLDRYRDSGDPVVRYVTQAVWFHYDDCDDHLVCLSKQEWDYFQRLLLLLATESSVTIHSESTSFRTQAIAGTAFFAVIGLAVYCGWGYHLLLLAIPCGALSIALAYQRNWQQVAADPFANIIFPFATLTDLETAYHASTFRKVQYRRSIAERRFRTVTVSALSQAYLHVMWLVFGPVVLLFQSLPSHEARWTATTA